MRPVRLELKGFSTYRDATVIDFADLDLVAFVGPTGSGKSTIIDGITFALYGSIARYKSTNLVAPVISQLANEARVRLDFTIGTTEYTAVRVVRRTAKGATTKEARLESKGVVLAGNARELDREIEGVLGLDFDQFTKTVVLPQGDFARFLTETPEARQGLLRRLLGMDLYRAMGSAARDRAKAAETKTAALREQQGDRPTVTADDVAVAQAQLELLEASKDQVIEHAEHLANAEAEAAAAQVCQSTAAEHLDTLRALKIPAAAKRLEKATEALESKRTIAVAVAVAAKKALADAAEVQTEPIVDLQRTIELHNEVDRLHVQLAEATEDAKSAARAAHDSVEAEREAASTLAERTEARDAASRRAGAAGLRDILEVGLECPVCEQVVHDLPSHDSTDELAAIDAAVDEARHAAEAALAASRTRLQTEAETHARMHALEERIETMTEALDGAADVEATRSALDEALASQATLDAAREEVEEALVALQEIEDESSALDEEAAALRRELTATRDHLAALDPPAPGEESITSDWNDLAAWGKAAIDSSREAKRSATARVRAAEKTAQHHRSAITKALAKLAESDSPVGEDPLSWIAGEHARRTSKLESLRAEHEAQQRTAERIETLHRESAVAGELGRLLSARGFEKWLMADVMHTLAARATDRLFELSGGAYSLLTDGTDFTITDHRNADETRSARTLSGGETFLASLALALALADNIADLATEGAPAIESMFLDEGFGTLDPDTLDVVASAIEELGSHGRLVGVVTHIRDLAERIPVRFEVSRTPNGSTVTRTTLA